jgi:hypothetical protein
MDVDYIENINKNATHEYCVSVPFTIETVDEIPIPPHLNDATIDTYHAKSLAMSIWGSKHNKIHDSKKDSFRARVGISI